MDGGFRGQRPTDRRVVNRAQPTYQQAGPSPAPAPEAPQPVRPTAASQHHAKKQKAPKRFIGLIIVILVIVLGAAGWFMWSRGQNGSTAIDGNKYQAVSLTDGQIYFGKLHMLNSQYVKVTGAYYLQAQTGKTDTSTSTDTSTDQNNVKLIKLGNKIYGPEDDIVIAKDQILTYENLNPDGQVAKWLKKNDGSN